MSMDLVKARRSLAKKWSSIEGPLNISGVGSDVVVKENLAQLMENQQTAKVGSSFLTEASTSVGGLNGAQNGDWKFQSIALALVRRTFPELFANKVVAVQAMPGPVGLAFALRMTYDNPQGPEAGWDRVPEYANFSSTGSSPATLTSAAGLSGAWNGGACNNVGLAVPALSGNAGNPFAVPGMNEAYPTQGVTTSVGENLSFNNAMGAGTLRQLSMRIERRPIEAATRKLGASYTVESANDIKTLYGLDIEREMINYLQYEITAELDRELIWTMKRVATNADASYGGAVIPAIDVLGTDIGITQNWGGQGEKFMNIVSAIINQANNLAITTRRGAGNFVIVSPRIATILQGAGHQFIQYTSKVNATTTSAPIGRLNGNIEVYRDQYAVGDMALVGYKGATISDAGVVFCPYTMGITLRAVSQDNFEQRVGVMSRYALVDNLLGAGRYYRLLAFTNVDKLIAGSKPTVSGLVSGI